MKQKAGLKQLGFFVVWRWLARKNQNSLDSYLIFYKKSLYLHDIEAIE